MTAAGLLGARPPGVYVDYAGAVPGIVARRTDIAGIVGIAARGPLFTPVRVQSWGEFVTTFGQHVVSGHLAYAVEGYFAGGGRTAWVVRAAHPGSARPAQASLPDDRGAPSVLLTASTVGTWAHRLTATVTRDGDRFELTLRDPEGPVERWRDLAADGPGSAAAVLGAAGTGSRLVSATVVPGAGPPAPTGPRVLAGGADGLSDLTTADVLRAVAALEPIQEIALLACPDLQGVTREPVVVDVPAPRCDRLDAPPAQITGTGSPPEFPPPLDVSAGQAELIGQCERNRDRFAVLDPPRAAADLPGALAWRATLPSTSFAACYFPWVLVPDPRRPVGTLRMVPPSGHVLGVFARVDRTIGVHKAPANEPLERVADVAVDVDDPAHGDANAAGVNVIRGREGGPRIMGARTLAWAPWRFVNVRRLVTMIEESVRADLGEAVFEPNRPGLWAEVDRSVRGFLDGLWRAGMLDGATAADAFDVRCDAETNPPDLTDAGRLTCLVALRPSAPAEFVEVRVTLGPTQGAAPSEVSDG